MLIVVKQIEFSCNTRLDLNLYSNQDSITWSMLYGYLTLTAPHQFCPQSQNPLLVAVLSWPRRKHELWERNILTIS
jgi:hypothetical protein